MATSPFARKAKKKGKGVAKKWYFEVQCPSLNVFPIIQRACVSLNIQCTEKSSKMTFPTAVSTASHCPQSAPCLIFPPNQTELDRFLRMAPVVPMEEDVLSGKKQQSVWSDLPEEERKRADWYRSARFARLSGAANLCCKVPFARQLNRLQAVFPSLFRFWPKTWLLPEQLSDFHDVLAASARSKTKKRESGKGGIPTFIAKPDAGCQGDGIFLVRNEADLRNLDMSKDCVVQAYMPAPLLLDQRKFDMRIYVLVSSLKPFRCYICKEGLVRIGSQPYVKPARGNVHDMAVHLTNYSLNKRMEGFKHDDLNPDGGESNKRTLSSLLASYRRDATVDADLIWTKIKNVVRRSCMAMLPILRDEAASYGDDTAMQGGRPACRAQQEAAFKQTFQILGFDVILDENLNAFLLEVNNNPSLSCVSTHDLGNLPVEEREELKRLQSLQRAKGQRAQKVTGQLKGQQVSKVLGRQEADASANVVLDVMQKFPWGICKCMDSHAPHLHSICAVDVKVKHAAVSGALGIVMLQREAARRGAAQAVGQGRKLVGAKRQSAVEMSGVYECVLYEQSDGSIFSSLQGEFDKKEGSEEKEEDQQQGEGRESHAAAAALQAQGQLDGECGQLLLFERIRELFSAHMGGKSCAASTAYKFRAFVMQNRKYIFGGSTGSNSSSSSSSSSNISNIAQTTQIDSLFQKQKVATGGKTTFGGLLSTIVWLMRKTLLQRDQIENTYAMERRGSARDDEDEENEHPLAELFRALEKELYTPSPGLYPTKSTPMLPVQAPQDDEWVSGSGSTAVGPLSPDALSWVPTTEVSAPNSPADDAEE